MNNNTECFQYIKPHAIRLKGCLGNAFDSVINNRMKSIDFNTLVEPFRSNSEKDNGWRGEFWGKIIRSLILAYRSTHDQELKALIDNAVENILETQDSSGRISSYPKDKDLEGWDIWGRKYVLLGLVRYYEMVNPSEKVRKACCRLLDDLMTKIGPDKRNIISCGLHEGLAASSILGAVVGVYRISGERRYCDYAEWIISTGCSMKHDIFNAAIKMIPPAELGDGKAYEMMSCFKGLSEYYEFDSRPEYLGSIVNLFRMIRDKEIFITGVGGLTRFGETWFNGKERQTWQEKDSGKLGETCVTVTWIHLCDRVLRLTGDASAADEIERSLYNGILGSMTPDAVDWCHRNPTPLTGASSKIPADDQMLRNFGTPFDGHDCCKAQGPEALAAIAVLAFMNSLHGPVVNLYEKLEANFITPAGNSAELKIDGNYPWESQVSVCLKLMESETFELSLRIPGWCGNETKAVIGNEYWETEGGKYLRIKREWRSGDRVNLDFDLNPKVVRSEADKRYIAFMSGPIVLARDSRLSDVDAAVRNEIPLPCANREGFNKLWHFSDGSYLCDYASAGNLFNPDNTLRVWFESETGADK